MIAVRAINNHTPRGEGSGGRFRFTFRRGWVMIVAGRKISPAVVVCVFIVLFWLVVKCVDVVAMVFRLVPSLICGWFGRSVKAVFVFVW